MKNRLHESIYFLKASIVPIPDDTLDTCKHKITDQIAFKNGLAFSKTSSEFLS